MVITIIEAIRSDATTQYLPMYFVVDNERLEVIKAAWPRKNIEQ
jgi:hypothetical protein